MTESVKAAILDFIVEDLHGGTMPESITDEMMLIEQQVIDSLGIFELVAWIEDTWQLDIDPTDVVIDNFKTLSAIEGLVQSKLP